MQSLLLFRPVTAQIWFCGPPVGTLPPVQRAADPVIIEVGAGGDDLRLDGIVACAFHLAEIRGAARTHQGLQPPLPFGTHDLDLEIAATSRTAGVISCAAGGQRTGVSRG